MIENQGDVVIELELQKSGFNSLGNFIGFSG